MYSKASDLICDICDKHFGRHTEKYERHLYHHGLIEPKFKCLKCNKNFFSKWHFLHHRRCNDSDNKKVNKYVCDYCTRTYLNKANLQKHIQRSHEDINVQLRYKCGVCDVSFCENRLLNTHIKKKHLSYKNSSDSFQRKPLNTPWIEKLKNCDDYLKITRVHRNVITVEKYDGVAIKIETDDCIKEEVCDENISPDDYVGEKVQCNYCNKRMLKKSLRTHIQEVHVSSKKFVCDKCNQSYFRRYLYLRHKCGRHRKNKSVVISNL